MPTSTDVILYLILSLTTLIKLSIVFVSSKHGLITNDFIGSYSIELLGPELFTIILVFILFIISIITQITNKSRRYLIMSLVILSLSLTSIYNVNIVL